MPVRVRFLAVALGAVASIGALVVLVSSSAAASAGGRHETRNVIVVLRNQDRSRPATRTGLGRRRRAVRSQQAPVIANLVKAHAKNIHGFFALNAVSATVSPGEAAALRRDPNVAEVVPDGLVTLAPPATAPTAAPDAAPAPTAPDPHACAAPGKVQLNPEALQTMKVDSDKSSARTARSLGIDGSGVTVGYIADAADVDNPDFIRADGSHVFVDTKDFSGFGTDAPTFGGESFGDASMIAAQGRQVYDISDYSNFTLKRPCDIRVEGVAPGASLVGLFAFGPSNIAPDSSILEAIDYAITIAHVNVLNESFGINNYPDDEGSLDLISQADDQAVAAGITVVESTGDAGPTNTTGEAADDPNVISVGATTDYRLYDQIGYGGAGLPQVRGWRDDNTSSFGSSGFDQRGRTIDLVAPGEDGWAVCTPNLARFASCRSLAGNPSPVEQFGGTSMSSPLTAGVAALVIQAFERTHHGTPPSPALVKQLIASNTDDVGAPADQMGTGRVNAYKAVLAAEDFNQPAGDRLAKSRHIGVLTTSSSQLNAIDQPGTAESLTDTVTNESETPQDLTFSGRTIGTYQTLVDTALTLNESEPTFPDYVPGLADKFQKVTFTVPAGMGRLSASIAYHGAGAFPGPAKLTLINPGGKITSYSVPQGVGNFGNVQVTTPHPGKWTAIVFSRTPSGGGYDGPVQLAISAAPYASFGTVTPSSATLAPGQSVAVREQVSTPAAPGDTSGAIVVHATNATNANTATSTTIPVTLRSLIPSGDTTFTGTVTGGNGRAPISGQELFYQLDVPAGRPELNVNVTVQDAGNEFGAYLIDPQGEAVAYATNMTPSAADPTTPADQLGAQLHTLAPAAGRWRLAIVFAPVASGDAVSSPFTVNVNEIEIPASAAGMPDSASTTLAAGRAVTVPVSITNTGTAPEMVFPDARLQGSAPLALGAVSGADDPLPDNSNLPVYLVPTHSTRFNAQATTGGATPLLFESQFVGGDPDLASTIGTTAALSFTDNPIATGEWDVLPVEQGAFGATGPPPETAHTSASVVTRPFDPAVSTPTGDLEADSANPARSLASFAPITVNPGQTATIDVTITPSAAPGTVVTGTLFVDDTAFFEFGSIQDALVNFPQADEVAAIPYEYTVG